MVDQEWLELVREDVREFLRGTFLEGAPVVPVSSLTGAGFPELVETIARVADEVEEAADVGLFRLPVDRVFTMKGFGTVVTGTLISGRVAMGEEVEVSPVGLRARVQGASGPQPGRRERRGGAADGRQPPGDRPGGDRAGVSPGRARRPGRVAAPRLRLPPSRGRRAEAEEPDPRPVPHGDERGHGADHPPRPGRTGTGRGGVLPSSSSRRPWPRWPGIGSSSGAIPP